MNTKRISRAVQGFLSKSTARYPVSKTAARHFIRTVVETVENRLLLTGAETGLRVDYWNRYYNPSTSAFESVFASTVSDPRVKAIPIKTLEQVKTIAPADPAYNVSLNEGSGSPLPGVVDVDNFSVRWSGQVKAALGTGEYSFQVLTYDQQTSGGDDKFRLSVASGQTSGWITNNALVAGSTVDRIGDVKVTLEADKLYNIRLDFEAGIGGAKAVLAWKRTTGTSFTTFATVQTDSLYSYAQPYTIPTTGGGTTGGMYIGNWELDARDGYAPSVKAALTVLSTDQVTISHSKLRSSKDCILTESGGSPVEKIKLTVQYTKGVGLNSYVLGKATGRFVNAPTVNMLNLQHNKLENTAGISVQKLLNRSSQADTITIKFNSALNIDGRLSTGVSGGWLEFNDIFYLTNPTDISSKVLWFRGYQRVQFVALGSDVVDDGIITTENIDKVDISWNHVENQVGSSRVEDNISLYGVDGKAAGRILVSNNYIYGGYTIAPKVSDHGEATLLNGGTGISAVATRYHIAVADLLLIKLATPSDATTAKWLDWWQFNGGGIIIEAKPGISRATQFVTVAKNTIVHIQHYGIIIASDEKYDAFDTVTGSYGEERVENAIFNDNSLVSTGIVGNTTVPGDRMFSIAAQGIAYSNKTSKPPSSPANFGNQMEGNKVGWTAYTSATSTRRREDANWTTDTAGRDTVPPAHWDDDPLTDTDTLDNKNDYFYWSPTDRTEEITETDEIKAFDDWLAAFKLANGVAGTLDKTFSTDGVVTNYLTMKDDQATAVLRDAAGGVIVVGVINDELDGDFIIMRYKADGGIDTLFGGNGTGYRTTDFGGNADKPFAAVLDPDGRIVVVGMKANRTSGAGSETDPYASDFAVARYNANGAIDMSFNGGTVTTTFSTGSIESARAVAIDEAGKIVVAGTWWDGVAGNPKRLAIVRYKTDGTLDQDDLATSYIGFSGDGMLTESGFTGTDEGSGIALSLDSNDRIYVAGSAAWNSTSFFVYKFKKEGILDDTFDGETGGTGNGLVSVDFGQSDEACYAIAVQSDNKIVLGGKAGGQLAFARLNPNGSLDTTFDGNSGTGNGKVLVPFDSTNAAIDECRMLLIHPDQKIVAVGLVNVTTADQNGDLGIVRLNTNGRLDVSFGANGKALYDTGATTREVALDVSFWTDADGRDVLNVVGFRGNQNDNTTNHILITQWLVEWPFYKDDDRSSDADDDGSSVIRGYDLP